MQHPFQVFFKKISHIPRHQLLSRLLMGVKKYISGYPQAISIQTVSACNLKCKHCFINDYRTEIQDGVIKIMQFDEFVLISEKLRPLLKNASICYFSTFEAILNKNLFNMMDVVLEINPKMKFPFLSNTMELSLEKINQLEKYPVPEINISLDGCTKQVVESFKTEVSFDKIIETIHLLKTTSFSNRLAVTFVAHKNNIHELPDYVDFVHTLGIRQIYVSNILTFTKNLEGLELYSKKGNTAAEALFEEAVKRAKKNRQIIGMPGLTPILKGCQATETFFIDSNGNVAPCDFLAVTTPFTLWGQTTKNPPVIFGNIHNEDPLSIYKKKAFKDFRKAHRLGRNLPVECENCIDAYGLMCSNRTTFS
jgi:radical SAM protein with 4Fe4S-binding SPASM domain